MKVFFPFLKAPDWEISINKREKGTQSHISFHGNTFSKEVHGTNRVERKVKQNYYSGMLKMCLKVGLES